MRKREVASSNLIIYKTYKMVMGKVIGRVGELFLELKKLFC
jgi:sporulation protein YlmC with PRC-barrel domain